MGGRVMAIDKDNRALQRVLALLDGDANDALVWRNEDGAPVSSSS